MDTEKTVVVFRKWRPKQWGHCGDGILALFPEIPTKPDGGFECEAYERIGGHGGADYWACIRRTRPATPAEYADCKIELEGQNYGYILDVRKRASPAMHDKRRKAAREH